MVITVSADALAPNGARPSAGTVLTEKLDMFSPKFLRLLVIPYNHNGPDDIFDGLVQEEHNSTANALELSLSRTNPSL